MYKHCNGKSGVHKLIWQFCRIFSFSRFQQKIVATSGDKIQNYTGSSDY